jgi:tetratricopeptide (TPR) repeat protein
MDREPSVHSIFCRALEIESASKRAAYLDQACVGEPLVRGRVEQLLDAYHKAGSFMQAPAAVVAATVSAARTADEVLGDYRIVREVGRGGMGLVYEAEQISLGRRVALKVLPFAAALDTRQLQRFKNEAHAAAQLHHTNIVPVYGVGQERGVHFYAMQFIEGQNLDILIQEQRRLCGHAAATTEESARGRQEQSAPPGAIDPHVTGPYTPDEADRAAPAPTGTQALGALSTDRSGKGLEYFRTVARLAVQAAQALEHAHQLGVVHRDIKPANLLVDVRGNLWVTDFGLAFWQNQPGLTMTGALLGTLRYMSPEQAMAKRVLVDHRTDIYSLGVTLYELLTLEHAFDGRDRQELLRLITFEEPVPPRKRRKTIPAELETIALKAMAKNPAERYATAQELADDLERFLKDEPIRARRPTLLKKINKWAQRHKTFVRTTAVFTALILVILALTGWQLAEQKARNEVAWAAQKARNEAAAARQKAHNEAAVHHALNEAALHKNSGRFPEAIAVVKRARALAATGVWDAGLPGKLDLLLADLQILDRLEDIHSRLYEGMVDPNSNLMPESAAYAAAFRDYGIDVEVLSEAEAAAAMRRSAIHADLIAALDLWTVALCSRDVHKGRRDVGRNLPLTGRCRHLFAIAQAADPDPFRSRLRLGLVQWDAATLKDLAADPRTLEMPATTLNLLGTMLIQLKEADAGLAILQKAQRRYPDDYWINNDLGNFYRLVKPPRFDHAVRFLTAAVALRPGSAGAHSNLGLALDDLGDHGEAELVLRKAVALKPGWAIVHHNLAKALYHQGELDEAMKELQQAVDLDPAFPQSHAALAIGFYSQKEYDKAIAAAREAIDAYQKGKYPNEEIAGAYLTLGQALRSKGSFAAAFETYKKALEYQPDYFDVWHVLVLAVNGQGRLAEMIPLLQEDVAMQPDNPGPRHALGTALMLQKDFQGAKAYLEEAVKLKGDSAWAHFHLGLVCLELGEFDQALACFKQATVLQPTMAEAHYNIGVVHEKKKEWEPALAAYHKALKHSPRYADAWYAIGNTLNARNDLAGAVAAYKKAVELRPDFEVAQCNLGGRLIQMKQFDEALRHLQIAAQLDPKDHFVYRFLGHAHREKGNFDEAVDAYQEALRLQPNDAFVSQCLKMAQSQQQRAQKLAALVAGKAQPADPLEAVSLAEFSHAFRHFHATEARLYREAFDGKPALAADLKAGHRYHAACAAAQAGCGKGQDAGLLASKDKTQWRQQALAWLRANLEAWQQRFKDGKGEEVFALARKLTHWLADPDLAGVREAKELSVLPAAEQQAWRQLWAESAALAQQAGACFQPVQQWKGTVTGQQTRRVHEMKMLDGKTYVIDLVSDQFDTYLLVEDDQGKTLAEDDDGGEGLNSRLVFVPPSSGTYRLVATSYGQQGAGPYTLSVQEFAGKKK